jgi:pimeloyl-ACP methyl ester carboxylesterase
VTAKLPMTDVVVLLPGILGSVLQRDGKDVWAPTPGAMIRAIASLGRNVKQLELHDDPWERDDLGDGVVATRLMPDVHFIPGLWGIDGYSGISRMIADTFDVVPGTTYVEFPYDWRRDNRHAALQLQRVVAAQLHVVRRDRPDAKVILIGHSMGGLVARYYLECLDGWKDARMLITFGTPYRGSLNALDFIANGFTKKLGPLTLIDLTRLLRSLTSVYQLLPVYPCVATGGGNVRIAESAPGLIPGLDLARAQDALTGFHRAIEAGVARHDPAPYSVHSVVGITQGTKQSARLDGERVVVESSYDGEDMGGDGTVPRVSATPIETDEWQPAYQPMYSADRHASLQNDAAVRTQLVGILSNRPRVGFKAARGSRLEMDEVVAVDEPLTATVLPDVANLDLVARIDDLRSGRRSDPVPLRRDADDVHHLVLPPQPAGDYRVRVEGVGMSDGLVDPVHGLLSVVGDEALLDTPDRAGTR